MPRVVAVAFFISLLVPLTDCSSGNSHAEKNQFLDNDYYEFASSRLNEYDIPAQIMLPNDAPSIGTFKTEVIHDDGGYKWQICIGPRFELEIEDYGSFRNRIQEKKKELAANHWLKITYLVNKKHLIVYKRELIIKGLKNSSTKVGKDHITYHVLAECVVDGITYEVKSKEEGTDLTMIRWVAKSAKSMKPSPLQ